MKEQAEKQDGSGEDVVQGKVFHFESVAGRPHGAAAPLFASLIGRIRRG
jgi:hypothetical protein